MGLLRSYILMDANKKEVFAGTYNQCFNYCKANGYKFNRDLKTVEVE